MRIVCVTLFPLDTTEVLCRSLTKTIVATSMPVRLLDRSAHLRHVRSSMQEFDLTAKVSWEFHIGMWNSPCSSSSLSGADHDIE